MKNTKIVGCCFAGCVVLAASCGGSAGDSNTTASTSGGGGASSSSGAGATTSDGGAGGGPISSSGGGGTGGVDHCTNGARDDGETDIDCGGGACPPCAVGKGCSTSPDCESLSCGTSHACIAPTCTDAVKNGGETDVDCGGADCPACEAGRACSAPSDCASGDCTANKCRVWAVAISALNNQTCALTQDGGVRCWGQNNSGELGDGTETSSSVPVSVSISNVAAISGSCALTTTGGVKCWGGNLEGELGNGTTHGSSTPVDVSNLSGIKDIAFDSETGCALTASGGVKCWGWNAYGQLGTGSSDLQSNVPVDVPNLTDVKEISGKTSAFCALKSSGQAACWGFGYLGNGSSAGSNVPVDVSNLATVTTVITGNQGGCALTSDGSAHFWGYGQFGEFGNGDTGGSLVPLLVPAFSGVRAISLSSYGHTCAIMSDGQVKCTGFNSNGQLGNGTTTDSLVPVFAGNLAAVRAISTGFKHSCALLTEGGKVVCWGSNSYGQLGDGTTTDSSVPVEVVRN